MSGYSGLREKVSTAVVVVAPLIVSKGRFTHSPGCNSGSQVVPSTTVRVKYTPVLSLGRCHGTDCSSS